MTMNTQPLTVGDLRAALLSLRQRTGDNTYSHTVERGRFQLCRVEYGPRGRSTVTPLSPYQDAAAHFQLLQTYTP